MPVPAIPVCAVEDSLHAAPLTPRRSCRPGVHASEDAASHRPFAQPDRSTEPYEKRDDDRRRHSAKLDERWPLALLLQYYARRNRDSMDVTLKQVVGLL